MKNLLIVESPAKAKTIQNYVGKDYQVIATVGHLIDLPKSKLGVDTENNYEMMYEPIYGKKEIISKLKKAIKETDGTVYLAPDPDREGESIAWQVTELVSIPASRVKRAVFHEITKDAIKEAINNPRKVDDNLVEAQQARRIIDRLVGYPLTQLLWDKITYGLSAGRVQSAALRLIVEKELEIRDFVPEKFAEIHLKIKKYPESLFVLSDGKGSKKHFLKGEEVDYVNKLEKEENYVVSKVTEKIVKETPPGPLTTATMQQAAFRRFGFSAKMTMSIAQELYQGVDLKDKGGLTGLITYMRTDSMNLNSGAVAEIRDVVEKTFGKKYLEEKPRFYKTRSKVAQEAHEAIRPTSAKRTPESIKDYLSPRQYRLYSLIWQRTVATQMTQSQIKETKIELLPEEKSISELLKKAKLSFQKKIEVVVFEGFSKLFKGEKPANTETYKEGDSHKKLELNKFESETLPPARFNDATLVKMLEKLGIGRPSTYATIIGTLITREYIERKEKQLFPTATGEHVTKFLLENFPSVIDYKFTSEMEDKLDEIANAKLKKKKMLDDFYPGYIKELEAKKKTIEKSKYTVLSETDKKCTKCGNPMVLKIGRWGKYYECTNIEEKHTEPFFDESKYYVPEEVTKEKYVLKKGRFGAFWAHPDYPNVKKTLPLLLKDVCPTCGKHLVEKKSKTGRSFIGCSGYPECKYIKPSKGFFRRAYSKK